MEISTQSLLAFLNAILNFHRIVVRYKRCIVYSKCSVECDFIMYLAEFRVDSSLGLNNFLISKDHVFIVISYSFHIRVHLKYNFSYDFSRYTKGQ